MDNSTARQPRRFRGALWQPVLVAVIGLALIGRAVADDEAIQHANRLSEAFRAAAKKVLPTVVRVNRLAEADAGPITSGPHNPFRGTPFEDFFDEDMPGFRFPRSIPRRMGIGSGVIIDASGVILTNNHVVEGADPGEITIELAGGERFKATEIKHDPRTDLAIVRIKPPRRLPAANLGDSNDLAIGDWVIAIGSPFELDQTVSAGIISAKGRTLDPERPEYLQTDAAINPGNSGGPLVNLRGEVVGINTAIASRNGGYQGIGFAVPSNRAKWVSEQLIAHGKVRRAYLGVTISKVGADVAEQLGVEPHTGALVTEVFDGTPAAKAGFKEGDLIVRFAGRPVNSPVELQHTVEQCPIDSKHQVQVRRDGKPMTLRVTLKPMPGDSETGSMSPEDQEPTGPRSLYTSKDLGLSVTNLIPDVAEQLGYENFQGVVITRVNPRGIAAGAGLVEGALIMQVGRTKVKNVDQFKAAIEKLSIRRGIMLLVRMGRGNRFVVLKRS